MLLVSEQADRQPPAAPQAPEPNARLRDLDVLEGTWRLEGRDSSGRPLVGTVIREWLPGGFFLTQRTEIEGHPQDGLEYIGYDSATDRLRSLLFGGGGPGPFCSFALEYFWEIDGDTLTIWHGHVDSPAKFVGTIDRDARTVSGAWEWPGGGYDATTTRID
jgi:hypothetical protein